MTLDRNNPIQVRIRFPPAASPLGRPRRHRETGERQRPPPAHKATCGTIRLKLLKIGALARTSVRRITFAMASGCPYQRGFALGHTALTNAATR
jgi:hypothetical protein